MPPLVVDILVEVLAYMQLGNRNEGIHVEKKFNSMFLNVRASYIENPRDYFSSPHQKKPY